MWAQEEYSPRHQEGAPSWTRWARGHEFAPPAMKCVPHQPCFSTEIQLLFPPSPILVLLKAAVFPLPAFQVLISFLSRQKFGARREMVWQETNRQRVEKTAWRKQILHRGLC